ncbi:SIMPL domain-containing protein [Sporomusa aerivorans]|uniref:SIMPL domain-containing protein n=1 Tax=Sporomusa aerivorans TaxID=204936 RepID=UPI00352A3EFB
MYKSLRILVLALLVLTTVLPAAWAAEKNSGNTEIQVSGSHQEEITPDIAYINVGTLTEAETVTAAQTKNAEVSERVRSQLEALGIKSEYIKTANYSVTPLYKNDDNGKRLPTVKGYQVNNSIIVTANADKAGEVVDTALNAGANQVNSIRFGKRAEGDVKNAALAQAVRDALSKADAIASALNKRVVKVTSVSENGINLQSPEVSTRLYAKADSLGTPISAGLLTLSANVQVTVELD